MKLWSDGSKCTILEQAVRVLERGKQSASGRKIGPSNAQEAGKIGKRSLKAFWECKYLRAIGPMKGYPKSIQIRIRGGKGVGWRSILKSSFLKYGKRVGKRDVKKIRSAGPEISRSFRLGKGEALDSTLRRRTRERGKGDRRSRKTTASPSLRRGKLQWDSKRWGEPLDGGGVRIAVSVL